jgi:L-fucose isomerase-like protein
MINLNEKIKTGFVCFGEVNTPREFIDGRCEDVADALRDAGLDLVTTAPVADDPRGEQAARAVTELSAESFDVLVVCIAGWIPTWAVISVIEPFKHKPMVLFGLTGWQEGGKFVTTADQAGSTALRKPMEDMGYTFKYIVNYRNKPLPLDRILSYCRAAGAAARLKQATIGMAGYRDMRLYGTLYDGISLKGQIGPEIQHFDLLELQQIMESITDDQLTETVATLRDRWDFKKEPQSGTVENSVKLYLALRKKIEDGGYDAFSFVDVDGIKKLMGFAPAGAMTLLHDEMDIPTVPENDSMGAVTQLIVRFLTGQIAAYLEFYEFMTDGALMGVPDYVPAEIVDGEVTVLPSSFGDFGEGLLNVSKLKTGKVTIARLGYCGNQYQMHFMTGTARTPIVWEEAGWAAPAPQLPSLEIVFDNNTEEFIQNVMGQHYIISYGDNSEMLKDLCSILGVTVI